MCVIFTVEKGANLTEEEIESAGLSNADGWGLSWPETQTDGRRLIRWIKGLDTDQVFPLVKFLKDVPYIAHARLATAGGEGKRLTHPFPVTRKVGLEKEGVANRVLFHNGHWGGWADILSGLAAIMTLEGDQNTLPGGEWSDSRLLAYLLSQSRFDNQAVLDTFSLAGKVAVMGKDGTATYGGKFPSVREGIKASNMHWDLYSGYEYVSCGLPWGGSGHHTGVNSHIPYTAARRVYDPLDSDMKVGDTIQIDTSCETWLEKDYHNLCVKLTHVGDNFSVVAPIDGKAMVRTSFPNKSLVSVTEVIKPLAVENGSWMPDTPIKVGHYIQYKRVTEKRTIEDKYGRVVGRFCPVKGGPVVFDVWDASDQEKHTVVEADIVEHFAATGQVLNGKLLTPESKLATALTQADGGT